MFASGLYSIHNFLITFENLFLCWVATIIYQAICYYAYQNIDTIRFSFFPKHTLLNTSRTKPFFSFCAESSPPSFVLCMYVWMYASHVLHYVRSNMPTCIHECYISASYLLNYEAHIVYLRVFLSFLLISSSKRETISGQGGTVIAVVPDEERRMANDFSTGNSLPYCARQPVSWWASG